MFSDTLPSSQAISKGYIVKSGMKQSVLQAWNADRQQDLHHSLSPLFQEKAVHMQCESLFIVRLYERLDSNGLEKCSRAFCQVSGESPPPS